MKFSTGEAFIGCSGKTNRTLRTCKNCKSQFDPLVSPPDPVDSTPLILVEKQRESLKVSKLDTPDSGKVFQYWHCCGSEDLFDPGCTASPHSSYDD